MKPWKRSNLKRSNLKWSNLLIVGILGAIVCVAPALAKKNVLNFALEFRPQQSVAAAEVVTHHSMRDRSVELRLTDGRAGDEPSAIGTRTDDDDQRRDLTATNDVVAFVDKVFEEALHDWGVDTEDGADLVLEGELLGFDIEETNQAVGALYKAVVRISFDLKNKSGKVLWSGSEMGDASRYGKKFSNANCNEVLSDAVLEAWAALISDNGLHEAWAGK